MTVTVLLMALIACLDDGRQDGRRGYDPLQDALDDGIGGGCGAPCAELPATERFARLTSLQWEETVQDLLYLDGPTGLSETFLTDQVSEGFENDAASLEVAPELWQDYQRAAEALAAQVVADLELYARVVPEDRPGVDLEPFVEILEAEDPSVAATSGARHGADHADRELHVDWLAVEGLAPRTTVAEADRDGWIRSFGQRAHRRPLTDDEVAAYAALFDQGPELIGTGDDFADGAQLVLAAMLQSPWLLYRIEASEDVVDGRIPLSSWELASKLSYALWNTMPDDELFAAAESGALVADEELAAQAGRMLDDPRAHDTVADFHRQLLNLDNYVNITKDPGLYPEFGPTTAASMQAEAQAFVEDVVFGDGGVHALLTSTRTFVNEDLAPIYGVPGVEGDALVPVELNPAERAGLLTLSGFLALEADGFVHSPIRRGVFVNLELMCVPLPPPPDGVPPLPPPDGTMTTRDRVDAHTGEGTCGEGCHSTLINPIGFGYERYDALGRYRAEEYGLPVSSADSYPFAGGVASYDDAVDLAGLLGADPGVHGCYVGHWLEYLQGRHRVEEDEGLVEWLGEWSLADDLPIRDLLVELVLTDSFRYRDPEAP